ncbi:MAG: hypothetical protein R2856_31860 [Caldilineaceae bacterium]
MVEQILRWLQQRVTWRLALLLFGVQIVVSMLFFGLGWAPHLQALGNHALIDSLFAYSADDLYRTLGEYGEVGRVGYRAYLIQIDFLYGTLAGIAFASVLLAVSRSLRRFSGLFLALTLLPVGMILFDYAEDLTLLSILARFPEIVIPAGQPGQPVHLGQADPGLRFDGGHARGDPAGACAGDWKSEVTRQRAKSKRIVDPTASPIRSTASCPHPFIILQSLLPGVSHEGRTACLHPRQSGAFSHRSPGRGRSGHNLERTGDIRRKCDRVCRARLLSQHPPYGDSPQLHPGAGEGRPRRHHRARGGDAAHSR